MKTIHGQIYLDADETLTELAAYNDYIEFYFKNGQLAPIKLKGESFFSKSKVQKLLKFFQDNPDKFIADPLVKEIQDERMAEKNNSDPEQE